MQDDAIKKKMENLLIREALFRTAIENSMDFYCSINSEGRLTYINKSFLRILGLDNNKLVGEKFTSFFSNSNQVEEKLKTLSCTNPASFEKVELKIDKILQSTVDIFACAVENETLDGIEYFIFSKNSFDESKIQFEENLKFRSVVFGLQEMVALLDSDMKIKYQSPPFLRTLGYTNDELHGKNPLEITHPDDRVIVTQALKQVIDKQNDGIPTELRLLKKDGEYLPIEAIAQNFLNIPGINSIIITARNIHNRNKYESDLIRNGRIYSSFVQNTAEGISRIELIPPMPVNLQEDEQARYYLNHAYLADCNSAFIKMYGFKDSNDLIGRKVSELWFGTEEEQINILLPRIKKQFSIQNHITSEKDVNGNCLYFTNNVFGLISNDKLYQIWCTQVDITGQKEAEEALKESEEMYRTLVDTLQVGVSVINLTGKILACNIKNAEMFGYKTTSEILSKNAFNLTLPENRETLKQTIKKILTSGQISYCQLSFIKADGNKFIGDVSLRLVNDFSNHPKVIVAVIQDITEKILAEQALKRSESQFRLVWKNSRDGMRLTDSNGIILEINDAYCSLVEKTPEELIGKPFSMVHFKDEGDEIITRYKDKFNERSQRSYERLVKLWNGKEVWMDVSESFFLMDDEKSLMLTMFRDITERRKTEEVLRLSESRLNQVINLVPHFIFAKDIEGNFILTNQATADAYGITPEELLNKKDADFAKSQEEIDHFRKDDLEVMEGKVIKLIPEEVITDSEGKTRYLQTIKIPFTFSGTDKPAVLGVSTDITKRKLAEELLKKSEKKYKNLFDDISDSLFILNPEDEAILEVNKAACELYGFTKKEFLSMSMKSLTKDITRGEKQIQNLLNNKTIKDFESIHFAKNGDQIHVLINADLIEFEGQKAVFSSHRDITTLKKVEETVLKLSQAVEQSPASVIITDTEGKIEYVNSKFTEVSGYTSEEAVGKTPRIIRSGFVSKETYTELWNSILAGNEWRGELYNKKKNGDLFWETVSIRPIKNLKGITTHFLAVKEDITEKKMMDLELKQALDRAEESSRLKSSLLANMSHELRTPMNGILGFAQLLNEEIKDPLGKQMVQKIQNSGKRLMTTLNTILELSELESNKFLMTINKINIYNSLMLALKEYEEKAIQKGLVLEYQIEEKNLVCFVDENIFNKIIVNLVDNALKFTSVGRITVKLSSDGGLDDGLFAKISVSDTGIGIEEKDLEIIFHEFRQASEGLGRNYEGNGLGLTLARKMARLMEGDITVESIPGKGSTFTYTIPAQIDNLFNHEYIDEEEVQQTNDDEETRFNVLPEILLVEDNLINKEVVEVFLRGICKIDHAVDGEGAIKMALQKHYDAILMDINLGSGLTGVDVVKEIKKHNSNRDIPIVALTGYAMLGDKEKFLKVGMTNYLAKPFTKEELINEIRIILKDKAK